jgi:hypothetical protein
MYTHIFEKIDIYVGSNYLEEENRIIPSRPNQPSIAAFSLGPLDLLLDLNLREFPPDRSLNRGVFRLAAGASQRIAGVSGVFYWIAPGFRKHKIAFGQVFPFRVRELRHASTSEPSSPYTAFSIRRGEWVCPKLHAG